MNRFNLAEIFKALSDDNRLKILELLSEREMNAGGLLAELNITQPTLSHHTKLLCESGLVMARKEGKWTYYSISQSVSEEVLKALSDILSAERAEGQTHINIENRSSRLPSHLL